MLKTVVLTYLFIFLLLLLFFFLKIECVLDDLSKKNLTDPKLFKGLVHPKM